MMPGSLVRVVLDVTDYGPLPNRNTLRATVNPYGMIDESDASDNVLAATRTIPGARGC